jgi:hypothetical protein
VIHELDVIAVILARIREVVGKFLALCEQLLVAAEATGHRMAARVDYLRVRQNQVYQADVPEVVRHLVDEERCALAMYAGIVDEFPAEGVEFFVRQLVQNARILRCAFLSRPASQPL